MSTARAISTSDRYTALSDRFRSLWTFYQFLAGVFKHQRRGDLPVSCDFQALHRRLQDLVPHLQYPEEFGVEEALDDVERKLRDLHREMRSVEREFAPSLLRRFFDHLKRQDEKILFALVKFYLQYPELDDDVLDKLDILLTRVAEIPLDSGRVMRRDGAELNQLFARLLECAECTPPDRVEVRSLGATFRELESELGTFSDFHQLLASGFFDRHRQFKHQLGPNLLHPDLLVAAVTVNIRAKNLFRELYQDEEVRILEDTNRVLEIERHLERHPEAADAELRGQFETFRTAHSRFYTSRKQDNVKREELVELRRAMEEILERFEPRRSPAPAEEPTRAPAAAPTAVPASPRPAPAPVPAEPPTRVWAAPAAVAAEPPAPARAEPAAPMPSDAAEARASAWPEPKSVPPADEAHLPDALEYNPAPEPVEGIEPSRGLPPDPLLEDPLRTIAAAVERAGWSRPAEQLAHAAELRGLGLEPWEIDAFRRLPEAAADGLASELQRFLVTAAALRLRMDEEAGGLERQRTAGRVDDHLLDRAAGTLDRARAEEARFRWFLEGMLYRGEAGQLEQTAHSRHRFLQAWSRLWLEHHAAGGSPPL